MSSEAPAAPPEPPARLRVLLIGSFPPPVGGSTVLLDQLRRELDAREDVELEVVDTSVRYGRSAVVGAFAPFLVLARALRRIGAQDAVSLHASPPGVVAFGPVLLAACRLAGRPLVIRGFGGSFDIEYEAMPRHARWRLERAFRADRVLLETHQLIAYFQRQLPTARFEWYSNSRPELADPGPKPAPAPGPRRFVFIGHVKPTKGIREILDAARLLGPRCVVDIYGPLLEGCTAEEIDAQENTRYRGVVDPPQVVSTLREYDAALLPSYHYGEGYPGIVLEAFTAGRPVVATRWRAFPEIVEDGFSGLLVQPRDVRSLAEAMQRLCDSTETLRHLQDGALQQAERFSSRRWTQTFVEICRGVLRDRSSF